MNFFLHTLIAATAIIVTGNAFAASVSTGPQTWKVLGITGTGVHCGDKVLAVNEDFATGCLLVTPPNSAVKIISKQGVMLVLGPDGKAQLGPTHQAAGAAANSASLLQGASRWIFKKGSKTARNYKVTTPTAVMGIRGTEVFLTFNPVMGESEIVSFNGTLDFGAKANSKNKVTIKKGQWGGLGGRFGTKIAPPIDVPAPVLASFHSSTEVATSAPESAPVSDYYEETVPAGF